MIHFDKQIEIFQLKPLFIFANSVPWKGRQWYPYKIIAVGL